MQKLIFINGAGKQIDLTSGNFGITEWEGFSADSLNIQSQQVPFQDGAVFLDALMEPRDLSVTLAIQDENDLELRYQLRREIISAMNPKLGEGVLIYTNDFLSKQIHVIPQLPVFENHNSNDSGTPKASLSWTACNPYWEDLEETEVDVVANEVTEITNEGDIPAQVEIKTHEVFKNGVILNLTNKKQIQILGNHTNDVYLDTNIGKKKIVERFDEVTWANGGIFYDCASGIENTIFVGPDVILKNPNNEYFIVTPEELRQSGEAITSVCWNNGIFIITGVKKIFISDDDGWTWELVFTNTDAGSFATSIYKNGKCVVAGSHLSFVSSDLHNWTILNSLVDYAIFNLKFINSLFFAIGWGKIFTSADGETWSINEYLEEFSQGNGSDITYGGGKYIAVEGTTQMYASNDLQNWTQVNPQGVTFNKLHSVEYYSGQFIAVGDSGKILKSSDGVNWSEVNLTTMPLAKTRIVDNELFIVGGAGVIYSSYDLSNWDIIKNENENHYVKNMIFENEKLLINTETYSLSSKPILMYTDDMNEWKYTSLGQTRVDSVAYANGLYLAWIYVSSNNYKLYKSVDAVNWEEVSPTPSNLTYGTLQSANNVFFNVKRNFIYKSVDGINWIMSEVQGVYGNYKIIYTKNQYWMFDYSHSDKLYTSVDGINWITGTKTDTYHIRGYDYGNNVFVLVNDNGGVYYSGDGYFWTLSTTISNMEDVCFDGLRFWLFGYGKIYKSYDGIHWTLERTSENGQYIKAISKNNTIFIAGFMEYNGPYNVDYYYGGILLINKTMGETNIISQLSSLSDMSFNLEVGLNKIKAFSEEGNFNIQIKFRQKYIGV